VEAAQMGQLPQQVGIARLHTPGNCGHIGGFCKVPWSGVISEFWSNLDSMIPWTMEQLNNQDISAGKSEMRLTRHEMRGSRRGSGGRKLTERQGDANNSRSMEGMHKLHMQW
jgi:hypothetical protein